MKCAQGDVQGFGDLIGSAAGMMENEIQYRIAYFNGCSGGVLFQGVQDFVKHKVDENSAIIFGTAGIDSPVVFWLVIVNHRFNGQVLKFQRPLKLRLLKL